MNRPARATLRGVLLRYLILTGGACLLLLLLWATGLALLINSGFVLRADAAMEASNAAARELAAADTFDAAALPPLCRYVLFAAPGSDTVLASNLDDFHLRTALNAWHGGSGRNLIGYTQYHLVAPLADGSVCLLQFDYSMAYGDPALRGRLPDFQLCYFVLLVLLLVAAAAASTHHTGRLLAREAARLQTAGEQIAAGDLTGPAFGPAEIREFGAALSAMQTLRETLSASLKRQWALEQQRTEQTAALAHDLKTPLTVISGNAELLMEGDAPLTPAQRESAAAILRGAERARGYLAALRAAAAADAAPEPFAAVKADDFLAARAATGQALCAPKRIAFACQTALPTGFSLCIRRELLARAVDNLLDNAARCTPAGGNITLQCAAAEGMLYFTVRDTGPGFTPEALQKAGQFLYTGEAARPADGHQGLGLYAARAAAAAHGGTLTAKNNTPGPGASVTLSVAPAAEA